MPPRLLDVLHLNPLLTMAVKSSIIVVFQKTIIWKKETLLMITIEKSKNILTLKKKEYGVTMAAYYFDINTGSFMNEKKKKIKTFGKLTKTEVSNYRRETKYAGAYFINGFTSLIGRTPGRGTEIFDDKTILLYLKVIDKLSSLSMKYIPVDYPNCLAEDLSLLDRSIPEWIKYCDSLNEGDSCRISTFIRRTRQETAYQNLTTHAREIVDSFLPNDRESFLSQLYRLKDRSTEQQEVFAYYALQRNMFYLSTQYYFDYASLIIRYLDLCNKLETPPRKENDFLRELTRVTREYEFRKNEIDKAKIAKNYDKHSKSWNFTYNGFTVVTPTVGEDLIREGKLMNHCVGSYVDKIVDGSTYIVFVRKTNDIDTPYITCQVHTSGIIGQYYLAHDRLISSEVDKDFQRKFQLHLLETWN